MINPETRDLDLGGLLIRSLNEPERLELVEAESGVQPWQFDLAKLTGPERQWLGEALRLSISECFLRIVDGFRPKKVFTWADCGPSLLFPIPKRGTPGESVALVFSYAWPAYVRAMELIGIRVQLYCHPAKEGEETVDGNVVHLYLGFPDGHAVRETALRELRAEGFFYEKPLDISQPDRDSHRGKAP